MRARRAEEAASWKAWAGVAALVTVLLVWRFDLLAEAEMDASGGAFSPPAASQSPAVAVDLYLMSSCPDAHACVKEFAPAVMELGAGAAAVRMHFIGKPDAFERGAIECKHGERECEVNRYLLCAQEAYSQGQWYPYTVCVFSSHERFRLETCAADAGVSFERLRACAAGEAGARALRDSVAGSLRANVSVSCTAHVDGRDFCQHNVVWRKGDACASSPAAALTKRVCGLYRGDEAPRACAA